MCELCVFYFQQKILPFAAGLGNSTTQLSNFLKAGNLKDLINVRLENIDFQPLPPEAENLVKSTLKAAYGANEIITKKFKLEISVSTYKYASSVRIFALDVLKKNYFYFFDIAIGSADTEWTIYSDMVNRQPHQFFLENASRTK